MIRKNSLKDYLFIIIFSCVLVYLILWLPVVKEEGNELFVFLYSKFPYIILFFLVFYLVISLINRKGYFRFDWSCFIALVFGIYCELVTLYRNGMVVQFWKIFDILIWPLLYVASYDYFYYNKNFGNEKNIKLLLTIFMIIFVLFSIQNLIIHLSGNGNDGEVIFPIYSALFFFPLYYIFVNKSKLVLAVSIVLIVCSTKRAGLLSIVFALIFYLLSTIQLEDDSTKKKDKTSSIFFALAMVFIGIISIIELLNLDIIERFMNIKEDGGSGRELIWSLVIDEFNVSTIWEKLFGHGYHAVTIVTSESVIGREILAHNDYLEILFDYGIVGLILIILWILTIAKKYITVFKTKDETLPIYSFILIIFVIISFLSYLLIQSKLILTMMIVLGFLNGNYDRKVDLCEEDCSDYN